MLRQLSTRHLWLDLLNELCFYAHIPPISSDIYENNTIRFLLSNFFENAPLFSYVQKKKKARQKQNNHFYSNNLSFFFRNI